MFVIFMLIFMYSFIRLFIDNLTIEDSCSCSYWKATVKMLENQIKCLQNQLENFDRLENEHSHCQSERRTEGRHRRVLATRAIRYVTSPSNVSRAKSPLYPSLGKLSNKVEPENEILPVTAKENEETFRGHTDTIFCNFCCCRIKFKE